MQRHIPLSLAAVLTLSTAVAFAQSGDLSGVTMHVLDSLDDVETVVLSLDANRAEGEQGAENSPAPAADAAVEAEGRSRDAADGERRAERRERDALHDTDVDERSEGRLEDRDVPQRTVAAPPAP